jgi:hypothetical protein
MFNRYPLGSMTGKDKDPKSKSSPKKESEREMALKLGTQVQEGDHMI